MFHQSKWSRTIDLNTTHILLFKSLRDIQQNDYLGKQLNCLQPIKEAYKLATAEPFGHLIIVLDPRTSQGLLFSSLLIGPEPSIFYISSLEAVIDTILKQSFISQLSGSRKSIEKHRMIINTMILSWTKSIIGPEPSIFYISSLEAVITNEKLQTITNEKETFAFAQALGK